jgi:hypothetical protein
VKLEEENLNQRVVKINCQHRRFCKRNPTLEEDQETVDFRTNAPSSNREETPKTKEASVSRRQKIIRISVMKYAQKQDGRELDRQAASRSIRTHGCKRSREAY